MRAALAQMDALAAAAGGSPSSAAAERAAAAAAADAADAAADAEDDAADARSHRRSRLVAWLGLAGLTAHWVIFARLTYWRVTSVTRAPPLHSPYYSPHQPHPARATPSACR